MLKKTDKKVGALYKKNVPTYKEDSIVGAKALKKQEIIDVVSLGSQLTLLANILFQVAEQVSLDTPEYTEAKIIYGKINNILVN